MGCQVQLMQQILLSGKERTSGLSNDKQGAYGYK